MALAILFAVWLFAEHVLGKPLLFNEGPDPTTLDTSLICMIVAMWAFLMGECAGVRERVERLERSQTSDCSS